MTVDDQIKQPYTLVVIELEHPYLKVTSSDSESSLTRLT